MVHGQHVGVVGPGHGGRVAAGPCQRGRSGRNARCAGRLREIRRRGILCFRGAVLAIVRACAILRKQNKNNNKQFCEACRFLNGAHRAKGLQSSEFYTTAQTNDTYRSRHVRRLLYPVGLVPAAIGVVGTTTLTLDLDAARGINHADGRRGRTTNTTLHVGFVV